MAATSPPWRGDRRPGDEFDASGDASSSAVQAVVVWYGAEDRLPPSLTLARYAAHAPAVAAVPHRERRRRSGDRIARTGRA